MITLARDCDIPREAARLAYFRRLAEPTDRVVRRNLMAAIYQDKHGIRPVGGGAPQIQATLTSLDASVTKNTFTTFATIVGDDNRGPFSTDYFNTLGATWTQESMGIMSTTATPTVQFRTAFGTVLATIATMLAQSAVLTTISGLANINWYLKTMGVVKAASGATSTMLVTGYVISQIVTAAANNIISYMTNATPPTAVTTDLSTAVFLDLQLQWGTSSVSNTTTTNYYALSSLWS